MTVKGNSETGGMTQAEVAELLGVTKSMVGQIERRAIRKLREAVKSYPALLEAPEAR